MLPSLPPPNEPPKEPLFEPLWNVGNDAEAAGSLTNPFTEIYSGVSTKTSTLTYLDLFGLDPDNCKYGLPFSSALIVCF